MTSLSKKREYLRLISPISVMPSLPVIDFYHKRLPGTSIARIAKVRISTVMKRCPQFITIMIIALPQTLQHTFSGNDLYSDEGMSPIHHHSDHSRAICDSPCSTFPQGPKGGNLQRMTIMTASLSWQGTRTEHQHLSVVSKLAGDNRQQPYC